MTKRIGFACKWIDHPEQVDGIKPKDNAKKYNTGSTTITWLNRQTREVAEQKLWDLMVQNLTATKLLVERVGQLEENLRMVRLSSDLLPVYTQRDWSYFWRRVHGASICARRSRGLSWWLDRFKHGFACVFHADRHQCRRQFEFNRHAPKRNATK